MQFALTPLDEHELLVFWTQLLVLVAAARFCGAVMRRLNLPSVIGQLGAGVILGPSIFGRVWTDGFEWFLPEHEISSGALFAVSWLGVAFLLVTAGFETDLGLIRRLGRAAALVTGFSLVVPLIGGLVVGGVLPESFIGPESDRTVFALFVAAALAVSALAVIAKILSELGLMRRDFGQITVAAGMANDVVGWIMLAVFTGFATSGEVSAYGIVSTVGGLAIFLALAMTVGQRVVDRALRWVRRDGPDVAGAMTVVVMTMLIYGVATQALGIEAVLGAFVAGVVLHRSRFQQREVLDHLESVTNTFLAPVFFATAGLRVDLGLLGQDDAIAWAGVVVAVAIVAKFVGAFVGAKLAGQSNRAATALGAGLNARGALEIVIASVGLSLGVFTETAYTVIVIVPLITSIFAAVSLRIVVRDWRGTDKEQERLDREEALAKNLVVTSQRILLPSKGHPASIAAAQLAQFAWPKEAPSTILTVGDEDADISVLEAVLDEREVDHNRSSGVSIGNGRDVAALIVRASRWLRQSARMNPKISPIVTGLRTPIVHLSTRLPRVSNTVYFVITIVRLLLGREGLGGGEEDVLGLTHRPVRGGHVHLERLSRGIALERAWVHGYDARPARHADEHAGDDNLGGNLREDTHVVMSNAWASGSGGEPCAVALCRQHRAVETRKS